MYVLQWGNPSVDIGKVPIRVPVGTIVYDRASVAFTGKGAANYGAVQQSNMMYMLEHFANDTPPKYPTVGQIWYDTIARVPKVLVNSVTNDWKTIGGVQISNNEPPENPNPGEMWLSLFPNKINYILYIYTGTGRYPDTGDKVGGWEPFWPTPIFTGAREEYDAVLELLNKFIGPFNSPNNGNTAIGTVIKNLTNFTALDTSLKAQYAALGGSTGSADSDALVKVKPDSNDWDKLLSAARYALSRLDLPESFITDISSIPFVTDGRPAPTSLLSLSTTDPRYPSVERRANTTFGSISLHRMYTETVNALTVALAYRYSIRGISGQSGTYDELDTAGPIRNSAHVTYEGIPGATTATFALKLNFASATELYKWTLSGGAIDIGISNGTYGGSSGDIDLRALLQSTGFLRVTQDKVRVFGLSKPLQLSKSPVNNGFGNLNAAERVFNTSENTGKTAKVVLSASKPSSTTLQLKVVITTAVEMTNAISIKVGRIMDVTPNTGATGQAFGTGPRPFVAADATGTSSTLVQKPAVLP